MKQHMVDEDTINAIRGSGSKVLLAAQEQSGMPVTAFCASDVFLCYCGIDANDLGSDPVEILTSAITSETHISELKAFFAQPSRDPKPLRLENVKSYRQTGNGKRGFSCTLAADSQSGIYRVTLSNERVLSKDDVREYLSRTTDSISYKFSGPRRARIPVPLAPSIIPTGDGHSQKKWFNFRPQKSTSATPDDVESATNSLGLLKVQAWTEPKGRIHPRNIESTWSESGRKIAKQRASPRLLNCLMQECGQIEQKWITDMNSTPPSSPRSSSQRNFGRNRRSLVHSSKAKQNKSDQHRRLAQHFKAKQHKHQCRVEQSPQKRHAKNQNRTAEARAVGELLEDHALGMQKRMQERSFWKNQAPITAAASAAAALFAMREIGRRIPVAMARVHSVLLQCERIRKCSQACSMIAMEGAGYAARYVQEASHGVERTLARVHSERRAWLVTQAAAASAARVCERMCAGFVQVERHWYRWCLQQIILDRVGDSCPDIFMDIVEGKIDLLVTEHSDGVVNYNPGTALMTDRSLPLVSQIAHAVFLMFTVLQEYGQSMLTLSIEGHIHAAVPAAPEQKGSGRSRGSTEQHAAATKLQSLRRGKQQRISDQRASALADAIEEKGVPRVYLRCMGYGGRRPIGTPEENRRVEIKVMKVADKNRNKHADVDDVDLQIFDVGPETELGQLFLAPRYSLVFL